MHKADYREMLQRVADTGKSHTAKDVPVSDMRRLYHQLWYQIQSLGLDLTIETDRQKQTVTVLPRKQPHEQH